MLIVGTTLRVWITLEVAAVRALLPALGLNRVHGVVMNQESACFATALIANDLWKTEGSRWRKAPLERKILWPAENGTGGALPVC